MKTVGYVLRSRFSLALRWYSLLLGLRFFYALLERLHQVNNLCTLWRFWRRNRNLLAFALLSQHGLDPLAVFVAVLSGLNSSLMFSINVVPSSISSSDNFEFCPLAISAKFRTSFA
jgi:hypothetical protein